MIDLKYIPTIAPHHTPRTIINATNSPRRGFIGTGSRNGLAWS